MPPTATTICGYAKYGTGGAIVMEIFYISETCLTDIASAGPIFADREYARLKIEITTTSITVCLPLILPRKIAIAIKRIGIYTLNIWVCADQTKSCVSLFIEISKVKRMLVGYRSVEPNRPELIKWLKFEWLKR